MARPVTKEDPKAAGGFSQSTVKIGEVQIISASGELFNHVDEGLPMWAGDGDRDIRTEVEFEEAFAEPPSITLGLIGIDAAHDQNLRFWLQSLDVTTTGFTIEFRTWADTHLARASASWQAVGKSTSGAVRASIIKKKTP